MSFKSGLFSALTAVVLILALGNGPVGDNLPDSDVTVIAGTTHGFFLWDVGGLSGTVKTATIVSLIVFVIAVAVLGALAGRARPLAAFIGGWGAAVGAAAISSIVYSAIIGDEFGASGRDPLDEAFVSAGQGTAVMVVVGWLFGIAVMLGSFGKGQVRARSSAPVGGYAPPPGPQPGPGWDPGPAAPPPPPPPAPMAPTPPPAAPQIGAPPDRTQVYGQGQ